MNYVYNYLFEVHSIVDSKNNVYQKGDKVSVYSKTYNMWAHDGVILHIYKDSIVVKYGLELRFGFFGSLGSSKTIVIDTFIIFIRFEREKGHK